MGKMPNKPTGTAIVAWDQELAKYAQDAADAEVISGSFVKLKSGVMSIGGSQMKDNQVDCIIIDSVYENAFYAGKYDPDNVSPPNCFALNHDEKELAPHEVVPEEQK